MKIAPIIDALKAVRMRGCRLHDSPLSRPSATLSRLRERGRGRWKIGILGSVSDTTHRGAAQTLKGVLSGFFLLVMYLLGYPNP